MNDMKGRIERLKEESLARFYPICIEKYKLICESMTQTEGQPQILRRARVLENVLSKIPISIRDDELIVGNGASIPGGLEIEPDYGQWDKEEIDALRADGYFFDPDKEAELYELNEKYNPVSIQDGMTFAIEENEEMEAFMRSGVTLPPWKVRQPGKQVGGGLARSGLGLSPGMQLVCLDYGGAMEKGLAAMVDECTEELAKVDFLTDGAYERCLTLKAMRISLLAVIRHAERYAELADEMAKTAVEPRRTELLEIAEICRHVPANRPRTFREALQMFWFLWLVSTPGAAASMGRFDQYMFPYYDADIKAGRTNDEEVMAYLQMLRLKDMEVRGVGGRQTRKRHAGMAKWHNMTICGVKPDGSDATNALSYLILDAIMACPCPHHTVTLRVADSTPDAVIMKGLECQRRGLSMPAFVGDKSYIEFFHGYGTSIEDARDYCMTGCLDGEIQGKSVTLNVEMFGVPRVLDIFLNDGIDKLTGLQLGHKTGDLDRFADYAAFEETFKAELDYFIGLGAKRNAISVAATRTLFPDPLKSALMYGGIKAGIDLHSRDFVIQNGSMLNPVGMVNLANSMSAIKTVVYDRRMVTLSELKKILDDDWAGHEDLRKICADLVKYGNNDPEADEFVRRFYAFWVAALEGKHAITGGTNKSTAISITSHQPAGELTGATPDGRHKGEIFADGCASPASGTDHGGPLKVFQSALKIDQDKFQAMLLNMKFHPSAIKTDDDLRKLMAAMRTYFANGGKHVQFVICDQETLRDAKVNPDAHQDLMVRVAGYSAYFVQLGNTMQDEIISRTCNENL